MTKRREAAHEAMLRLFAQRHGPHLADVICERGEGVYLIDDEGKRYIDFTGGATVAGIGHGDQRVTEAIVEQMRKVSYFYQYFWISERAIELAERVLAVAPSNLTAIQFTNSGSEATETAIKIAHQYHLEKGNPRKHMVIGRWQGYHGMTIGGMAVSGITARRRTFLELVPQWPKIAAPLCYRCAYGLSYPSCGVLCAHMLQEVIDQVGSEHVSAFIAEPIGGAATAAMVPVPEYYPIVREICTKNDVLFIDDEVICGIGRTGKWFGLDHWGVKPDLMLLAKGLSGGYAPIAAVLVDESISQAFSSNDARFTHVFTMEANPVSCAASLAVLDIIDKENLVDRSARLGDYLREQVEERLSDHATVGDIRGKGMLLGVEIVKDKTTKEPFDPKLTAAYHLHGIAKHRGCMIYPGAGTVQGVRGDHFLISPPFTISEEQIDTAVDILDKSFSEFEQAMGVSL